MRGLRRGAGDVATGTAGAGGAGDTAQPASQTEPSAASERRRRVSKVYFSCTEPDTVTVTLLLPASTGTGASAAEARASSAMARGRTGEVP